MSPCWVVFMTALDLVFLWNSKNLFSAMWTTRLITKLVTTVPVPGAARSKDVVLRPLACWDCGFEPRWGQGCLSLWVLCVVRQRSLRWADHLSRAVLSAVVRRCVWSRNLKNEEAKARVGWAAAQKNNKKKANTNVHTCIHVERFYWFSTKSFCCTFAISNSIYAASYAKECV